jgi:hypothetical protein
MKATELIAKEREEQISKHGYTIEDDSFYKQNELLKAALFCINPDTFEFPYYWNVAARNKLLRKTKMERLVCAASFIAAQIDQELHKEGKYN